MTRPAVNVDSFCDDPLYPRIERSVVAILQDGKVVAPVDVLIKMGLLTPDRLEDWRHGRVPYLEKVVDGNLARLSRVLKILRFHSHDLKLEEAYSRHFVWPGKGPFHLPAPKTHSRVNSQ